MSSPYRNIPTERLSFLISYGSNLAALHRKIKKESENGKINDPMKIVEEINKLKEELKTAKQILVLPSYSLDERGGNEIIETVKGIVKDLIAAYREKEGDYKKLLEELDELKGNRRLKLDPQNLTSGGPSTSDGLSSLSVVLPFDVNNNHLVEALKELDRTERDHLLRCCPFAEMFTHDDELLIRQNVEMRKGVLINWLIGIGVIDDLLEGEQFLAKLVSEPSFNLMRSACRSNRFIISPEFVKCLALLPSLLQEEDRSMIKKSKVHFSLLGGKSAARWFPSEDNQSDCPTSLIMVNKSKCRLNDKVIRMARKSNIPSEESIRVLHLGKLYGGMDDVVVEDTFLGKFDELLKENKGIMFLGLQGVSRIHQLPPSVCELGKLKVLDLRSCQDLQSLPKDIGNLVQLICLDLSGCYQLDYIPIGIAKLSNLRKLLGFIIITGNNQQSLSHAKFEDLNNLKKLIKLTIRSRRMTFPTDNDLKTLNSMEEIRKLKISWVKSVIDRSKTTADAPSYSNFMYTEGLPKTLEKLELQAALEITLSRLLSLISKRSRYHRLEKLYIKGGISFQTKQLYPDHCCFPHVKILRLRYLPQLRMSWHEFQRSFPNLTYLHIADCPNLMFFPCDANGVWLKS